MDVLHFIKADHDAIRASVERLAASDGVKARRLRCDEVAQLLTIHLGLEKDFLYPELLDLFANGRALVDVGLANGVIIGKKMKLLTKLVQAPAAEQAASYAKRFQELKDAVLAHLETQEQALLPKLRENMRTEEREDLGEVFLDAKTELRRNLYGEGEPVAAAPAPASAKRRA